MWKMFAIVFGLVLIYIKFYFTFLELVLIKKHVGKVLGICLFMTVFYFWADHINMSYI